MGDNKSFRVAHASDLYSLAGTPKRFLFGLLIRDCMFGTTRFRPRHQTSPIPNQQATPKG